MSSIPTSAEPAGFFMLRRPLLPLEVLFDFHEKTRGRQDLFERELISLFSQPLLADAIYLASPALHQSLLMLISGNEQRADPGVLQSLYKYLIRACSRATPFGLFSCFATGSFTEATRIRFKTADAFERYTRLAMPVTSELGSSLLVRPGISHQTLLFVNSSLYPLGDHYRFVERIFASAGQSHLLSAVKRDELLEHVIGLCMNGCTFEKINDSLCQHFPAEQAAEYVHGLVQMQILVSGLEVNVTGPPYMEVLEEHLSKVAAAKQEIQLMEEIRQLLQAPGPLKEVAKKLTALLDTENIDTSVGPVLHTDLKFNTLQCGISQKWILRLLEEFEKISMLFQYAKPDSDLEQFKKAFLLRYETQEVPLLEALDAETGIGYGIIVPGSSDQIPLLDNLRFPFSEPRKAHSENALTSFKKRLLDKAEREGARSIALVDQDLKTLDAPRRQPGYFYWLGSIISANAARFDQGDFRFLLRAVGGASGLELLGRFCHADSALSELVKASARERQQRTGAVLAEIAHLPAVDAVGVLSRPHLSDYEIVYLAGSTKPVDKRILASDLMVSIRDGKQLIIRSRRLNKQVIPVLNNAHNFSRGLPVYRFLCELAAEHQQYSGWDWGPLSASRFLPRLTYKHLVISRASWNLTRRDFPKFSPGSDEFTTLWKAASQRLQIPRYFQICKYDQELFIDSDNSFSLALLEEAIYKTGKVRIVEILQEPGEGFIAEGGKHYANEIVIPFRPLAAQPWPVSNVSVPEQQTRRFMTASSWLFVKIYVGTSTADRIISELIGPYCAKMISEGKLQKWFFVRYQDPDHHLRIRFYHGDQTDFWQLILKDLHALMSGWLESGLVLKIQTDTYTRELERYQGLDYGQVESIFYADSRAVIQVIDMLCDHEQPEVERWLIALSGADILLDDLGLTLDEKLGLTRVLYKHLQEEFPTREDLKIQLDRQYRAHRNMIAPYMQRRPSRVCQIFSERSTRIRQILEARQGGCRPGVEVAASFVHMFFNRILASAQRQQELVMYHYLNKYYKTLTVRAKNGLKT